MSDTPADHRRAPAAPWAMPGAAAGGRVAVRALDEAGSGRLVLEDYRPLADSLEWRLGQEYLRQRGAGAFVGDAEPVPFVVNNDGNQSIKAAEVFFTSLVAAEKEGWLPDELFVLELGIGVGLFARYFLDWFRLLCDREGKDYYHRLCYLAADRSARMLRDAGRCGVFQNHPGRYRLLLADALCPEKALLSDPQVGAQGPRPLRAVFLNYLLDCLPACVVRLAGGELQLLHARTSLPTGADWHGLADADAEELRRLAALPDAERSEELLAVFPLVQAEYEFRAEAPGAVPYHDFITRQASAAGGRPVLHSHGALACLEALLALLGDGGVILLSDYGQTEAAADEFEHQRFSESTAVGINFALLGQYFSEGTRACWREPPGDDQSLHSRLLMRRPQPAVALRFAECYGEQARKWLEGPAQRARELAQAGRLHAALGQYQEALDRHPFSWPLLSEAAHFLTYALGNAQAGLALAREAVRQCPAASADVWNELGDCLFELGRLGEARYAYDRALAVKADDVRARYNLAFVHAREGEHERALVRLAEALARDGAGPYRERLLQKQAEVLGLLDQQGRRRMLRRADRLAGAGTVSAPGKPRGPTVAEERG